MGRKASIDASSPPKGGGNTLGSEEGWSDQKTKELLGRMKQLIAKPDVSKYKTSLQRFDWKRVQFDHFSSEDCHKQFLRVYKKLRKYKTLSDLVNDSLDYIENPYKGNIKKHPDHPKRPLTPYFRFFLSEREKYAAKHKDKTNLEITGILSEMYKKISIEDKEKLMNSWKEEMVDYRRKLEQFKLDHPEYYDKTPPRMSRTPIQVFTHENSTASPSAKLSKEDSDVLKKRYHDLSDEEKLPYILKAIEEWEKYKEELEMYKKSHPDFVATYAQNKCTLTQSDWRIHDKSLGKPVRPPANGYNLFCTRMMISDGMKHLTSRERIIECGQKWKLLTEAEKQAYQNEFLSMRSSFKTDMKNFMKSLTPRQKQEYLERERQVDSKKKRKTSSPRIKEEPMSNDDSSSGETEMAIADDTSTGTSSSESSDEDDEEEEEEEEVRPKKSESPKKTAKVSAPSHRPTTPISALFLYQKAHKEKFAAKHPNASKSDITIMLARRFNNLPKEKKAKWIQQEKEQRAIHSDLLRRKMQEEENAKHAPPELKPVTGEQIFQEQNKGGYLKKANGSSEKAQELMRRAWTQMNKERKQKYISVAHEQNAKNIAQHEAAKAAAKEASTETRVNIPVERNLSQKEIKSYLALEPKKVPNNALALFKVEQKPRLNHLTPAARNQEMMRLWNAMSTHAKNQYKEKAKAGLQDYSKKLERWMKSLPPQAHQAYQVQLGKRTKAKSKASNEKEALTNGTPKKRKAALAVAETAKKAKTSKEESDDSSEESSGDSSSSSSDDSDDSDSSSSDGDSSSDSDSTDSEEEPAPAKPPVKQESSDSSSSSEDDSDSD